MFVALTDNLTYCNIVTVVTGEDQTTSALTDGMRRICPIDFGFALELLRFRSFDE